MILKSYSELPALEKEPHTDAVHLCHNLDGEAVLSLVYATERDFLSVPKTYTLVRFKGSDKVPLEFHALDREGYLEQMELANSWFKPGVYELEKAKDYTIVLLLTDDRALEIIFADLLIDEEVYHAADAATALLESLKR